MQPVWVSLGDYDNVLAARSLLNLQDPREDNKGVLFGKCEGDELVRRCAQRLRLLLCCLVGGAAALLTAAWACCAAAG